MDNPNPEAPVPFFTDLSDFVAGTHQECRLIVELIERGRCAEALEVARGREVRAFMALRRLEKTPLPEVDLDLTENAAPAGKRYYRSAGANA